MFLQGYYADPFLIGPSFFISCRSSLIATHLCILQKSRQWQKDPAYRQGERSGVNTAATFAGIRTPARSV
jgi:hypothetical protein